MPDTNYRLREWIRTYRNLEAAKLVTELLDEYEALAKRAEAAAREITRLTEAIEWQRDHSGDGCPSEVAGLVLQGWSVSDSCSNVYGETPLPPLAALNAKEPAKQKFCHEPGCRLLEGDPLHQHPDNLACDPDCHSISKYFVEEE